MAKSNEPTYPSVTSLDQRQLLLPLQMATGMSRKGNRWGNAAAERLLVTLKAGEISEPYATKQNAYRGIANEGPGFYNALQLRSSLGCLSPNENARKIKLSDTTTFLRFVAQGALQLGGWRPAALSDVFALIDADLGRTDDFASAQVRR
jgi:transposase InsO family protein